MDKYFKLLDSNCQFDYSNCARDHKSRAYTMKQAFDELSDIDDTVIIELGTTRSFVSGGIEGCMDIDPKYWQPDNLSSWDWGAGSFTRVFAEVPNCTLHTVDINPNHIKICQKICEVFNNVKYYVSDSCKFLTEFKGKADLIYMDTGDMNPVEDSARLHEREAKIIVEREIVPVGGFILIDDVRNPTPVNEFGEKSLFGKAKYSLGVFLANGFDILMDEYQMLLIRKI